VFELDVENADLALVRHLLNRNTRGGTGEGWC
jgi:hypothetical protein